MNIAIMSRGPKLYSTRRLKDAAVARGHKVRIIDPLAVSIHVESQSPELFYKGKPLPDYDCVIPRIGASISFFGCAVLRQLEQMGVFSLNTSHSISVSRDKLRSFQVLSRHDVGLPDTAYVRRREDILPAIERVGGAPVVIKLLEGTQGVGVILADSIKIAEAIIETLQEARQSVLVQKFVAESKGKDIRAFVVGGKVVAAMRRTAQGQEFRSNVHRGGSAQPVELDAEFERTAVLAAQIMGLHVAGVDMLESSDGPQVMEVNSSPGLEGIEAATGVDVATSVIEHLENQVLFPELELRHRLALGAGYGIAEVPVSQDSELAGKTLRDTALRDREIVVLSINRSGVFIPAPTGDTEIYAGDTLICYGKLIALRNLVPHNRPKRKRKRTQSTSRTGS